MTTRRIGHRAPPSAPGSTGGRRRAESGHLPRKRFGQHFLTDAAIIDAIVRLIDPVPGQRMVEIGPGLGALTNPLLERLGALTVIELDRDLAARLRTQTGLKVIQADVLTVDFGALCAAPGDQGEILSPRADPQAGNALLRIVGNLPYNISSPILFHLFTFAHAIADQHFMLQKEVVDRMVAAPSTAAYGRLSVMLQWRYEMESVLAVPPASFEPEPRVHSSVIRMLPRRDLATLDVTRLSEIVKIAFSQRRKLLRHTLGPWLAEHRIDISFDLQRRAEEVAVAEYVALAGAA